MDANRVVSLVISFGKWAHHGYGTYIYCVSVKVTALTRVVAESFVLAYMCTKGADL